MFVWIVSLLIIHPSLHHGAPACPSTLEVLQTREHTPTSFFFYYFHFWIHIWVIQIIWGCVNQFDFRPLTIKNHLEWRACRWRATYCWKTFNESYNFVLNLVLIKGLYKKLWASKVMKVLILGNSSRFSIWESREKWHLGAAPMASHREYYKGEGDGFLQVWVVVSFVSLFIFMTCPCIKNVPTMH
jgi:hypothetical protein